jgi:hypothetical protein
VHKIGRKDKVMTLWAADFCLHPGAAGASCCAGTTSRAYQVMKKYAGG